jgi:hypothetical protein
MSRNPRSLNRFGSKLAVPIFLMLAACGGSGGGGVASIPPPPPTPTPPPTAASIEVSRAWLPSPATQTGTYDVIGLVNRTIGGTSSDFANSGEFRLAVSKPNEGFGYVLHAPSGFLPGSLTDVILPVRAESWDFNINGPNYRYDNPYGDVAQYFGQNLKEYEVADGSKVLREDYDYDRAIVHDAIIDLPNGRRVAESILFDIGLSYVAMGEWSWGTVTANADGTATPTGDRNSLYFVYGSRTPSADIPASGTATFDAHTLGEASGSGIPFTLSADFGKRSISTEISQAAIFDVSGSASFSNDGSFDIPLSGTAGSAAATGAMDGAFFGPHAEQVGGVFSLESQGSTVMQDAFVGAQH